MRPPIRYATTVDGGKVAFTVAGQGHTVLEFVVAISCNIGLDWDMPGAGDWYQALASHLRLVRFEPRGLANSDPTPEDRPMIDYLMDDIDAVAQALGLDKFALMTGGPYTQIALKYATSHPNTVRSLLINNPTTRQIGWGDPEVRASYRKAIRLQADLAGVDVMTYNAQIQAGPFAERATVEALERIMRTNDTAKGEACWEKVWELHDDLDYSPYVPLLTQRVLITTDSPFFESMAKELAVSIPGALLSLGVQDMSRPLVAPDMRSLAASRLADFIYGPSHRPAEASRPRASVALMSLTAREREVLSLVAAGHTNPEIGEALVLTAGTVSRHVANIYGKLGIHNRAQATALYFGMTTEGPS